MEEKEYKDLEGKKVIYQFGDGTKSNCIVSGIDWDVGLSIEDENGEFYRVCLNGPSSPMHNKTCCSLEEYQDLFRECVKEIKEGTVNVLTLLNMQDAHRRRANARLTPRGVLVDRSVCAFNQ